MRRTVYLSLAALGAASIATAAVVTNAPTESRAPTRVEAHAQGTETHHTRVVSSESQENSGTRESCRKHCPWFD